MIKNYINNIDRQTLLENGEVIALYKKGSMGSIVGTYLSINDIVDTERVFNHKFTPGIVSRALLAKSKYFTSLFHQSQVVPRIIKPK